MPPYEEEDFELVLGNRQLFFLAVVLFGLFFSIGYTVGYGRGRNSSDGVSAATQEPSSAAALSPVSAPPARPGEITAAPEPVTSEPAPSLTSPSVDPNAAISSPAQPPAAEPVRTQELAKAPEPPPLPPLDRAPSSAPSTAPAGRPVVGVTNTPDAPIHHSTAAAPVVKPAPRNQPAEPAAVTSSETVGVAEIVPGNIYLQVLASREAEPARKALREIKAKGHPVALDNLDPDWYRILIGPFSTREAADAYMVRLKGEGYNSFLRKF